MYQPVTLQTMLPLLAFTCFILPNVPIMVPKNINSAFDHIPMHDHNGTP